MKRNSENISVELVDQDSEPNASELAQPRTSTGNGSFGSTCNPRRNRPEIAVLGWNVRSYRLSLRESKG